MPRSLLALLFRSRLIGVFISESNLIWLKNINSAESNLNFFESSWSQSHLWKWKGSEKKCVAKLSFLGGGSGGFWQVNYEDICHIHTESELQSECDVCLLIFTVIIIILVFVILVRWLKLNENEKFCLGN